MVVNLAMTEHVNFVCRLVESLKHHYGSRWPHLFFDLEGRAEDEYTLTIGSSVADIGGRCSGVPGIAMSCTTTKGIKLHPRPWNNYMKHHHTKHVAGQFQRQLQKCFAYASRQTGQYFGMPAGSVHYIGTSDTRKAIMHMVSSRANARLGEYIETYKGSALTTMVELYNDKTTNYSASRSNYTRVNEVNTEVMMQLTAQGISERKGTVVKVDVPMSTVEPEDVIGLPLTKQEVTPMKASHELTLLNNIEVQMQKDAIEYMAMKAAATLATNNDSLVNALRRHMSDITRKWIQVTGADVLYLEEQFSHLVMKK